MSRMGIFFQVMGVSLCLALPAAAEQSPEPASGSTATSEESAATGVKHAETTSAGTESVVAASEADAPAKPAEPQTKVAAAPRPVTLKANIDLANQTMTVFENGSAMYTWPISSGVAAYATPRGTFRPQWTAKMWYSRKYDNAPMPHSVFINGGIAVHGTGHTGSLGRPASHGCIRLAPGNARTFYNLVHRHGLKSTKVSVYGTPKWRSPAVASRTSREQRAYASGGSNWFWGDWSGPSESAYSPGFTQRSAKKKRYAIPPAKYYGRKRVQRPQASGAWNW